MVGIYHPAAVFAAVLISFVLGALALVPVEAVALGAGPGLWWTTASLLAGLGLVCGLAAAGADAGARAAVRMIDGRGGGRAWRGVAAAMIRALAAVPAFVFVARHLFDGGFAATLPGARSAWLWLPALGWLGVAAALGVGAALVTGSAGRRRVVAAALVAFAVGLEYANRTLLRSEYPDVHAFAIAASASALGLAVWLAGAPLARATRRVRRAVCAGVAAAIAVSGALCLAWGLGEAGERWAVATRGSHVRHLARLVRAAGDRDGDGYAAVLGGGDCDDGDARVSPAAIDEPGDGIDQDCDGRDAEKPPPPPLAAADYQTALSEWRTHPEVRDALARVRAMNVVFVVVDALRADALPDTPERRRALPNLAKLADGAVRFERAFSSSSGTDAVLAALLTGRYAPFAPIETTLLEAVAAAGRTTHAVIPREVLRWAGESLITRGLAGLDRLVTDRAQRDVGRDSTGRETTDLGLAFLDRVTGAGAGGKRDPAGASGFGDAGAAEAGQGAPWFLWLHYFDVHEHHQMSESDPRLAEALAGVSDPSPADKYAATVALVDAEIGRVVQALEQRGLADHTAIVLASDHGESLGEDPRLPEAHGRFLYQPLVRVPILIRIPGIARKRVSEPVSLVDLAVTLVDLFGTAAGADGDGAPRPAWDPSAHDGRSLVPYLLPGAPEPAVTDPPPIPLHESDQHGVVAWPYKLLVRPADNLIEVYDLAADPAESRNLYAPDEALSRRLMAIYKRLPRVDVDRSRAARERRDALFRARRAGRK